jgi:predicted ferric reductase
MVVGWFAFKDAHGDESNVGFALFIGSVSILLMAWSNVLATRVSLLEGLFGGLDRMYKWHRWFGALAVGAMWLHTQTIDDVKGIRGASRAVAKAAEDLAGTATNLLYALVGISILRWIPTCWWRLTHKLLVVPYAFACWHFYTATKPYPNDSAWGRWFLTFMIAGLVAWAYRVVWRDVVRRGRIQRVRTVESSGDTVTLELEPLGRPLRYDVGQFAFLKFSMRGLAEPHPFTIASSPDEPVLRFMIRNLGDWTERLGDKVRPGIRVVVEGPYGRLHPLPSRPVGEVVWIAGGVGITPFVGAATSRDRADGPAPHLFYCVKSRDDAPGLAALRTANCEGRIILHLHASNNGSRLRADDLVRTFGSGGLRGAHVVMCGPTSLVKSMRGVTRELGARHIHVGGFDIRSGVGPDLSRDIDKLLRR